MKKLLIILPLIFSFSLFAQKVKLIDPVNFSDDTVVNVVKGCERRIYSVPGPYKSMQNFGQIFTKLGYRNIAGSSNSNVK
jgi:hypothetical protein